MLKRGPGVIELRCCWFPNYDYQLIVTCQILRNSECAQLQGEILIHIIFRFYSDLALCVVMEISGKSYQIVGTYFIQCACAHVHHHFYNAITVEFLCSPGATYHAPTEQISAIATIFLIVFHDFAYLRRVYMVRINFT